MSNQNFTGATISTGGGHVGSYNRTQINITNTGALDDPFDRLKPVLDATYDSSAREFASGCLEDTRMDVLKAIDDWIFDLDSFMFWLNGAAGTGKSTIAQTIALRYLQHRCGASFFFSRDQQVRRQTKYLLQTIVFQLGNSSPLLRAEITKALVDQTILTSRLGRQLRELLLTPISATRDSFRFPIVVILDAIDECDEVEAIARIIELFLTVLQGRGLPLKVFITSRPESHIRHTFEEVGGMTRGLTLHDVALLDVQRDIRCFVQYELKQIKRKRGLRTAFEDGDVEALVTMAAGLFIVAATTLKFIAIRPHNPKLRLQMILNSRMASDTNPSLIFQNIDMLYSQILDQATSGLEDLESLWMVLGTIVLSFARLSVPELSGLIQMEEDDVRFALEELYSVIYVPSNDEGHLRAFHASFHDYLPMSPDAQRMASLARDPFGIRDCGPNKEVGDLEGWKTEFLPGDLQYACRYWGSHLSQCSPNESLVGLVETFAFTSMIYWIEALSILGDLGSGPECFKVVLTALKSMNLSLLFDPLLELLHDTERFLFNFFDVIEMSASHIYISALPFTPKGTLFYRTWEHELEGSPQVVLGVPDQWDACLRVTLHSFHITSVAISQNGVCAFSSLDNQTVHIWDANTGADVHSLVGHSTLVSSVAISNDGRYAVSGSHDRSIITWDTKAGRVLLKFEGHLDVVNSVAISHDGRRIVSGSNDKTVRIWDIDQAGEALHTLGGHLGSVTAVAISPDGTFVISGSDDRTIRIWSAELGESLQRLGGHSDTVTSVDVSRDGARVISSSKDKTIRIWDAKTGAKLRQLEGHLDQVTSVSVSSDKIASSSLDKTIMTWDIETGEIIQIFEGHSRAVNSEDEEKRLCWLPPAYRRFIVLSSPLLVSGLENGVVLILRFPIAAAVEELPLSLSDF